MPFVPMQAESLSKVDPRPEAVIRFCADPGWAAEQKVDGHRRPVIVSGGVARGLNRRGEPSTLPPIVAHAFKPMTGDFILDAELLGKTLFVFDLVHAGTTLPLTAPYRERREALDILFGLWQPGPAVRLLPWYTTHEEKAELARRLLRERCEGMMFKRLDTPYQQGRKSLDWLKGKFRHDVDCVVTALGSDGKANMTVGVFAPGNPVPVEVGEVTALAGDGPRVKVGDVVTVKVQYATADDRLFHPTLPRIRTDKAPHECTIDQLDTCRVNKEVLRDPHTAR